MELEISDNQKKKEITAQYFISESENIVQRVIQCEQNISNKTNFYILVSTGFVGGIIIALTGNIDKTYITYGSSTVLIFLFVVGAITFRQILDLIAITRVLLRRAGRIRRWFLDNDKSIERYLPFPAYDDSPQIAIKHQPLRGAEVSVLAGNSAVSGFLVGFIFWQILQVITFFTRRPFLFESIPLAISILIGSIATVIVWKIQNNHVTEFLSKVESDEEELGLIHFPRNTLKT